MDSVRVVIPATTANLGPGFDCVGMALGLHNELVAEPLDGPQWIAQISGEGADELPIEGDNLALQAMRRCFAEIGAGPAGVRLVQHNRVPLCSGLGSSSTAIVGGLVAANALAGAPLSAAELLRLATEIEGHPDNVAPALLGGLVVVAADGTDVHWVRFDPPTGLCAVVAMPELRLSTAEARRALPESYPKADTVFNLGRAALLVAALVSGDRRALAAALWDRIHQPYRLPLIPGGAEVLEAARGAGALGAVISGAGPTLLAFCEPAEALAVGVAMRESWSAAGVAARVEQLPLSADGARLL